MSQQSYETKCVLLIDSESEDLHYLGIALYGDRKKINKLTGNLPLLR